VQTQGLKYLQRGKKGKGGEGEKKKKIIKRYEKEDKLGHKIRKKKTLRYVSAH
jgi:hypothetical protein